VFLLGSRYCETDRLADIAWRHFRIEPAWLAAVQAICDFVCDHLTFGYEHARATRTAFEAYEERIGVCRNFGPSRGGFLPLHEYSGPLREWIFGRYWRATGPGPDGTTTPGLKSFSMGAGLLSTRANNTPRIGRITVARGS